MLNSISIFENHKNTMLEIINNVEKVDNSIIPYLLQNRRKALNTITDMNKYFKQISKDGTNIYDCVEVSVWNEACNKNKQLLNTIENMCNNTYKTMLVIISKMIETKNNHFNFIIEDNQNEEYYLDKVNTLSEIFSSLTVSEIQLFLNKISLNKETIREG